MNQDAKIIIMSLAVVSLSRSLVEKNLLVNSRSSKRCGAVGVQKGDAIMIQVFRQQNDLITFSVVGEVN
jgi:hypothetical protein